MDEAEVKAVDIHEGIDNTLLILQHRFNKTSHRPEIQILRNYNDLPLVECYPNQLNQVFINILANAIDTLEEKAIQSDHQDLQNNSPQITIQTKISDSDEVEIIISDNGIGMSNSVRKKIFDPFFTTKEVGKGTGMGLPISYQIITEKHGGKLECISTINSGTNFIIKIPTQQQTN